MRDVLSELVNRLRSGQPALACQVVETRGSTPQKAGVWMIVDPRTGAQFGTLGGGCVEYEVKQKAIRRVGTSGAELFTFVLDHDTAWADGLICGGRMGILVEEFSGPRALDYFQTALRLEDERSGWTELVVLDPERAGEPRLGTRRLYNALGQLVANWPAPNSRGEIPLNSEIEPLESRPKPAVERGCARLPRLPRIRLVIVGAGHVGQAVATLASQVDFDVWVVDDRSDYANPTRFPTAEQCLVGPLDQILPALELTPQSFALVMTRGHGHDQEALGHLAQTAASYVGLIGSHRKIRMILDALRESGIEECALRRVVAPLGLDIGSQTVPEIAISIVAELVSWRNLGPRPKPSLLPERSRRASQPT